MNDFEFKILKISCFFFKFVNLNKKQLLKYFAYYFKSKVRYKTF
jgi:hypothetical protein